MCRQGAYALLADILKEDRVTVWLSGASEVIIAQGIPEGGNVGTLSYVLLPDTLIKELNSHSLGVGVGIRMPDQWKDHIWAGTGLPVSHLVDGLRHCILSSAPLPSPEFLKMWPGLEASAARALDLLTPLRIAAIFHAASDPRVQQRYPRGIAGHREQVGDYAQRSFQFWSGENCCNAVMPPFCTCVGGVGDCFHAVGGNGSADLAVQERLPQVAGLAMRPGP